MGATAIFTPAETNLAPPVSFPVALELTASGEGTVVFSGRSYGEAGCAGFYYFTRIGGSSEPVSVHRGQGAPLYLPLVRRS